MVGETGVTKRKRLNLLKLLSRVDYLAGLVINYISWLLKIHNLIKELKGFAIKFVIQNINFSIVKSVLLVELLLLSQRLAAWSRDYGFAQNNMPMMISN